MDRQRVRAFSFAATITTWLKLITEAALTVCGGCMRKASSGPRSNPLSTAYPSCAALLILRGSFVYATSDQQHPAMKRGVRELPAQIPTTFFLLSNSNYVFISTILAHHGLLLPDSPPSSSSTTTTGSGSVTAATPSSTKDAKNLFEEIVTNPAEWDGDLVALKRRVDPQGPQHGCKVGCSPNMCKGARPCFDSSGSPD